MIKKNKWLKIGIICVPAATLLALVGVWANERHMLKTTLEWGRLAPLPKGARNFRISTEGNMFSRSFTVNFTASNEVIQEWINASPGLREAKKSVMEDGQTMYIITPNDPDSYGYVVIDPLTGNVVIHLSWS